MNASFTVPGSRCSVRVHGSGSVRLKPDRASLAIHRASLAIRYVSLAIHCVSLAIHCASLAIRYVSLATHRASLAIHCASLAIHRVSLAIRDVSLAYVVSAFRRTEQNERRTTEPRTGNRTPILNTNQAASMQTSERRA